MRTCCASASPGLIWLSTRFTTPVHTANTQAAVAPIPPTSSNRAAKGKVALRPGKNCTVVAAVFSSVNITMARPKLKISRKFSCFIGRDAPWA